MWDTELTRQLNSMEDTSRLYQTVQDNKSSRIQATLPFSINLYEKNFFFYFKVLIIKRPGGEIVFLLNSSL
jgi:hypothetical protein